MDNQHNEPPPPAFLPITRHNGWTGEKMAIFCEALAETAVVAEACDQAGMGISGAYAARRRNPVFAAAWDAALSIARERLADTLLARSMEGNIEQIYKDGELVGERHVLDNRLASPSSAASTGWPRWAWPSAPSDSVSPSTVGLGPRPPVTLRRFSEGPVVRVPARGSRLRRQ